MKFLWPEMLWLLLILPLLVLLYVAALRRRKKLALQYAGLSTIKAAMSGSQRLRRHVPPALFLLALALMLVAVARPVAVVTLPYENKTLILAIDVSGSMKARDVLPSRFAAAVTAVKDFIEQKPANTRVGLVSFAGSASVIQAPTTNREDLLNALNRLQLQYGTAVGSGILVSLKAIFPELEFNLGSADPRETGNSESGGTQPLGGKPDNGKDTGASFKPVPPGSYGPAAVILLTDGQTTTGPDPLIASQMAAERGVRVYTIGVGTTGGEVITGDGWAFHSVLDEDALKEIANTTRAEYFYAGTAKDLSRIYQSLNSKIALEKKETETTALFAAGAACLAVLSALLSLLWFNRIV
jgi:Ca-activated chloride channel family protein